MDGLAVRWAENQFPFWNAVFLLEQGTSSGALRHTLQRAREIMRSKQQLGFLVTCKELMAGTDGDADSVLADEGFTYAPAGTSETGLREAPCAMRRWRPPMRRD